MNNVKEVLNGLGVSFIKDNELEKEFSQVLNEIGSKWNELTQDDKDQISIALSK